MTDDIDRAQAREAELLADALRDQARRAGLDGKTESDSATCCARCDDPIPSARRKTLPGVQLCVACQARIERTQKGARTR